jgi:hypothetical protein
MYESLKSRIAALEEEEVLEEEEEKIFGAYAQHLNFIHHSCVHQLRRL